MNHRRTHPDAVDAVIREYGYVKFDGSGTWSLGFGVNSFSADAATMAEYGITGSSYLNLVLLASEETLAQRNRVMPEEEYRRGAKVQVRARGYISPPKPEPKSDDEPTEAGYERQIIATNIGPHDR